MKGEKGALIACCTKKTRYTFSLLYKADTTAVTVCCALETGSMLCKEDGASFRVYGTKEKKGH